MAISPSKKAKQSLKKLWEVQTWLFICWTSYFQLPRHKIINPAVKRSKTFHHTKIIVWNWHSLPPTLGHPPCLAPSSILMLNASDWLYIDINSRNQAYPWLIISSTLLRIILFLELTMNICEWETHWKSIVQKLWGNWNYFVLIPIFCNEINYILT